MFNPFDQFESGSKPGVSPFNSSRCPGGLNAGFSLPPNVSQRSLPPSISSLPKDKTINQDDLAFVVDAMKYGEFAHISSQALGTTPSQTPVLPRPSSKRTYLLIQNTHAVNDLYIAFDSVPGANNGITLNARQSITFDAVVPQNAIYLAASGASTSYLLTYCNQEYGNV